MKKKRGKNASAGRSKASPVSLNKAKPKKTSQLDGVVSAAKLIELFLAESESKLVGPPRAVAVPDVLVHRHQPDIEFFRSSEKDFLVCHVSMKVVGRRKSDEAEVFSLRASYGLIFQLENGPNFDDAACEAFAMTNGFYVAYPYLREYFQDATSRMGLHPYRLPLLMPPRRHELAAAGYLTDESSTTVED